MQKVVRYKMGRYISRKPDRWIPVTERLPDEGERVLIQLEGDDDLEIAQIRKGISKEEREWLRKEEPPINQESLEWDGNQRIIKLRRSERYECCDEFGNNLVPYCWIGTGPLFWFGQDVVAWMPLPQLYRTNEDDVE